MLASKTKVLSPADLRCEYLVNPLGVDVLKPRLSWKLDSSIRGQKQTAYRIVVASSPEKLKSNIGDLWDTGKVGSDKSIHVDDGGKPLESSMQFELMICRNMQLFMLPRLGILSFI